MPKKQHWDWRAWVGANLRWLISGFAGALVGATVLAFNFGAQTSDLEHKIKRIKTNKKAIEKHVEEPAHGDTKVWRARVDEKLRGVDEKLHHIQHEQRTIDTKLDHIIIRLGGDP